MTCDERKDLLLLYAGDMLDPAEREALRAHLATGCPACAGALAEAEVTLAHMAAATPPIAPPADAFEKVLQRIVQVQKRSVGIAPRKHSVFLTSLLAAAAAIVLTSGLAFYLTRDARSFWRSSNLATVALTSKTQPAAHGQVWWDRDRQQWRVSVANLGPAPSGREYELWFIPEGGKPMRSQTFTADSSGEAKFVVPVPAGLGQSATAAITDEPFGGTDAPTGQIHLAGVFH